ncbi:MAG: MMPL family transporter [Solirubrobacterales bacterium]
MRRFAQFCFDHKRWVIGAWIASIVGFAAVAAGAGGSFVDSFSLPGSGSQRATDLLEEKFPAQAGASAQVVFKVEEGNLRDPAVRRQISKLDHELAGMKGVRSVVDPYAAGTISSDGKIGFATLQFKETAQEIDKADAEAVIETAKESETSRLQVNLGGQVIKEAERKSESASEAIGVLVAIAVLVLVLGSFTAMAMPLIVAISAIALAMLIIVTATSVVDIASFAPTLAVMIALGVGIDYALLILNRFRDERGRGVAIREATLTALDTAGRSVLFAGTTVVIALLGMLLLGVGFLNGPAIAAALAVLLTMVGALTLLPALLGVGFMGRRVKPAKVRHETDSKFGWSRWARLVERRPALFAVAAIALLLVLASPVTGMQLGTSDSGSDPSGSTTRIAYDQLSEGFGPGFNGPLLLVAELPRKGDEAGVEKIARAVEEEPGVAAVSEPMLSPSGDTAILTAYPTTKPQDSGTEDLLASLRDEVMPRLQQQTGIAVSIGGATASQVDLSSVLSEKLPFFIAVVVGLSLLLLLIVFRSLLIPLKAAVMNVLSIGAALGVITFVFQDGHFASLIGVDSTGPIESFLPVFLFAIVFGLSMDYEVFLVSRMHEEWEARKDAQAAVRNGLALTGKVITAAAIIMISVFASFMLGDERTIKLFGLGLASAVLFDAFVIRLLLVPGLMFIFDRASWWMPAALSRRLPRLSIEGPARTGPEPEET